MFLPSSSMNCGYGKTTTWFWRWKAVFRFRKIPIFDSPTFPMARSVSASRPRTLRATCFRTNGRSTVPGFDVARYRPGGERDREYRRGSETSHFRFRLGSSQVVERGVGLLRRAELSAKISLYLRHAQHGFGRNVPVIGQQGSDNIDRTGALLDRLPCFAIRLDAAKHILRSRRRGIIVDVAGSSCGNRRRAQYDQRPDIKSHQSGKCHRVLPADAGRSRATIWKTIPMRNDSIVNLVGPRNARGESGLRQ